MKALKSILFAFLTFASIQSATASSDPATSTTGEIRQMLQSTIDSKDFTADTKVYITFMLNTKNEVMVMSTDNQSLDGFIKSTLNYHSVASVDLEQGKVYTLPVLLKK